MQVRKSEEEQWLDLIREKLSGWGVQEIVTNPLVDPKKLEWFGQNGKPVDIINPVTADFSVMRTNLALPALMVVLTNLNRKQTDLKFFEIGKVYRFEGEIPQEELRLCLALSGNQSAKEWDGQSRPVDFYDVKGLIEALAGQMQIESLKFSPESSPILHADFSFGLESKSGNLGCAGKVSAAILEKMDIKQEVWLAEMRVDILLQEADRSRRFEGLARFPAVERDLAVVVDKSVLSEQIKVSIRQSGGGWVEEVSLFDYYHGQQIPPGKKSLAFHLVFRSPEKTLTEMEVNLQMERIVGGVQSKFNAQIRS
jgi:phenylalanyl-tRNA synthetase beta chain